MTADSLYRFRIELADIKAREAEHQRDHDASGSLLPSCQPAGCSPDASDIRKLIRMVETLLRTTAR